MENSLKQRIVGAVVLIGLAVIFLPAILKEKSESKPFQSEIPAKPIELVEHRISNEDVQKNQEVINKLEEVAEDRRKKKVEQQNALVDNDALAAQNQQSTNIAEVSAQSEKVNSENKTAKSENKQTIGENFKDAAWVVRVASFSNLDNAKNLVIKLKDAGHKAYRRDGKNAQNKSIHRIYVGPYIEKSAATKQLDAISKLSQSKAMLLAYDPLIH